MSIAPSAAAGVSAESGKSMGSARKDAGQMDEGGVNELYRLNQTFYGMPPSLSLVAKRTILINQAQQHSYTNPFSQNITFILNTGEYFVAPATSYLYFQVGYTSKNAYQHAKACISQGNAMQLFEEVIFTSASGTEVCRELNKGLYESFSFRYKNSQEYIDTYGQIQGAPFGNYSKLHDSTSPIFALTIGASILANANRVAPAMGGTNGLIRPRSGSAATNYFGSSCPNLIQNGTNVTQGSGAVDYTLTQIPNLAFCIPLDQLIGCFCPYMKTLLPAGLMAGGRLDIRLKDPVESLQFAGSCIESAAGTTTDPALAALLLVQKTNFVIQDIFLALDAFQMQDNVLKRLNQISAGQDGLSIVYNTYDYTTTNKRSTGAIECQVQQARSRIVRSWCVVRDSANIKNNYINSLAAEAAIRRASGAIGPGMSTPATLALTGSNTTGVGGGFMPISMTAGGSTFVYSTGTLIAGTGALFDLPQIIPCPPADPFTNDTKWGQPTVDSYQGVLGALYFPQQPITTAPQHYANALYMFGKGQPDRDNNCSVTYEDFLGGLGATVYQAGGAGIPTDPTINSSYRVWAAPYGLAVYGILAEKSQLLQLSGLPISNARLLRHKFNFAFDTQSQQDRTISCFTEFVRVAKIFLGGKVVIRE